MTPVGIILIGTVCYSETDGLLGRLPCLDMVVGIILSGTVCYSETEGSLGRLPCLDKVVGIILIGTVCYSETNGSLGRLPCLDMVVGIILIGTVCYSETNGSRVTFHSHFCPSAPSFNPLGPRVPPGHCVSAYSQRSISAYIVVFEIIWVKTRYDRVIG